MQKKLVAGVILLIVLFFLLTKVELNTALDEATLKENKASTIGLLTGLSFSQMQYYKHNKQQFANNFKGLADQGSFSKQKKEFVLRLKSAFDSPDKAVAYQGYFYKFLKTDSPENFGILATPARRSQGQASYYLNNQMKIYRLPESIQGHKIDSVKEINEEDLILLIILDKDSLIEHVKKNLAFVAESQQEYFLEKKRFSPTMEDIFRQLPIDIEHMELLLAFCHETHPLQAYDGYYYSILETQSPEKFYILAFPEKSTPLLNSYLMNEKMELFSQPSNKAHRHWKHDKKITMNQWQAVSDS